MRKRCLFSFAMLTALAGCGGGGAAAPSPSVSAIPATPPPVTFNDYVTYGFDNGRDVFNPNSTAITPANLANLHLGWQASLANGHDFNTQTQPILATEIPGHTAALFVGGGGSGNLYAYDASSGSLLWTRNLGLERYSCSGQTQPSNFGIGGTVAYDPSSHSLYVVGNTNVAPNTAAVNTLVHVDADNGAVLGTVNIASTAIGPTELNFAHTAVTLSNGTAYVGTSATCDISSWRGRVVAVAVPSMTILQTYFTVWNGTTQPWGGGGVWGWGGVSLDQAGNVFTGVGNADDPTSASGPIVAPFSPAPREDSGNAEAVLKLSAGLALEASHHPIPAGIYGSSPYAVDLDVDGTPAVFSPPGAGCDTMLALQAKSGTLYLYDTLTIAAGPVAQYALSYPTFGDEFNGGPAYSPATGLLYAAVPVGAGSLYPPGMIAISPGCGSPAVVWHTAFGPDSDVNGGFASRSVPAVSAGGVVLVATPCEVTAAGGCAGSAVPAAAAKRSARRHAPAAVCCAAPSSNVGGAVWALDASSGAVLNGGLPVLTTPNTVRMPPTVDGNWVYVLDNGGDLYGLTVDLSVPAATAVYRSAVAHPLSVWPKPPGSPGTH